MILHKCSHYTLPLTIIEIYVTFLLFKTELELDCVKKKPIISVVLLGFYFSACILNRHSLFMTKKLTAKKEILLCTFHSLKHVCFTAFCCRWPRVLSHCG